MWSPESGLKVSKSTVAVAKILERFKVRLNQDKLLQKTVSNLIKMSNVKVRP